MIDLFSVCVHNSIRRNMSMKPEALDWFYFYTLSVSSFFARSSSDLFLKRFLIRCIFDLNQRECNACVLTFLKMNEITALCAYDRLFCCFVLHQQFTSKQQSLYCSHSHVNWNKSAQFE